MTNKSQRLAFLLTLLMLTIARLNATQSNLHFVILGDSNTSIGGDLCNEPLGWTRWFVERMQPASCRSYARSGATWTNTSTTKRNTKENIGRLGNDNVIFNQVCRLFEATDEGTQPQPDVILIAAGTNDAWFQAQRPHVFDLSATQAFQPSINNVLQRKPNTLLSLAESVRYSCELLMQRFPQARLILLTPMQTTQARFEDTERVGTIIEQCAHRMSIPVIRQDYLCGVYNLREASSPLRTYDGTHTCAEGAKRNGYFLARQIEALLTQ